MTGRSVDFVEEEVRALYVDTVPLLYASVGFGAVVFRFNSRNQFWSVPKWLTNFELSLREFTLVLGLRPRQINTVQIPQNRQRAFL